MVYKNCMEKFLEKGVHLNNIPNQMIAAARKIQELPPVSQENWLTEAEEKFVFETMKLIPLLIKL